MLIDPIITLGVLGASIGLLILAPDWRPALALLCVCGALLFAFEQQELQARGSTTAGPIITLLNAVDVVSMACVGLIVLWTGLTYSRDYESDAADEVSKMELRRAARNAARRMVPQGWHAYRLPATALVLLTVGTLLLPLAYPSPTHAGVYAWTLLVLGGILTAATSDTLVKLDLGLLLICFGLRLCYLTQTTAAGFFELALFSVVPLVIALVMALLCTLTFARLGTTRLALLFEQARSSISSPSGEVSTSPRPAVISSDVR